MLNKSFTYYLGNALIALSFFIILFIYYPIIQLYLFPQPSIAKLETNSFYIEIPKIKVQSLIIPDVNPFNETEYRRALEKGIAQARGTAMPGEGTTFLFAHSSEDPWRITRYNIAFFRLGELKKGDTITVIRNQKKYNYKVDYQKTVWPTEVQYLSKNTKNQLILQTCTPIGTSLMRLLVFATPT